MPSPFHNNLLHLVLDVLVVMVLILTLTLQNARIRGLETKVVNLTEASIILLQDKLERDKGK